MSGGDVTGKGDQAGAVVGPQVTELVDLYFELCHRYQRAPLAEITVALRFESVTELRLGPGTQLADFLPLGEILKVDTTITVLDCSDATLGDYACFILKVSWNEQEVLFRNLTLQLLDLSQNGITDKGAAALVDGLLQSASVEAVILRGNSIGPCGGEALATWVRCSSTVRFLDVANNCLRLPGVHSLYHALRARRMARVSRSREPGRGNGVPRLRSRHKAGAATATTNPDASTSYGSNDAGSSSRESRSTASVGPAFEFEYDDHGGRVQAGTLGRAKPPRSEWWTAASRSQSEADGVEVRWSGNLVQQEIANSIVHGVGLVLSVLGAIWMLSHVRTTEDPAYWAGAVAYLIGLVVFYLAATLRHSLFFLEGPSKIMQVIDHSAVFVLIAGTYTPFALVNFESGPETIQTMGRAVFLLAWTAAAIGVYISLSCPRRRSRRVKMLLYIGMGWVGVVPAMIGWRCFAPRALCLLAGGGIIYTLGALVYLQQRLDPSLARYHVLWYGLVLVASVLHYFAVFSHVERRESCGQEKELHFWDYVKEIVA